MRLLRPVKQLLWGLCIACLISPALRAQTTDVSSKVDELEKEVQELKAEIAAMKGTAAPAAPTPAATAAPVAAAPAAAAAAPAPPAAPAAAPAASPVATLLNNTSVTGFVDTYYGYNFNQPNNRTTSFRAFDGPNNQIMLNMIQLIFDKPADASGSRLGYHLSFGYGNGMNVVNGSDPGGLGFAQYLKEGYLTYLAPVGKGLQVDVGKFVTPAGFEVIESKDDWNYSRGLLFTYAIPFYHFGVRAKYAWNDKVSLTGYLVNGWNNIVENNTGKTGGFSLAVTPTKKWAFTENYLVGPEMANDNSHVRQLSDTVVTFSPTGKLSLALNYDYGRGDMPIGYITPAWWTGVAGYLRYAFNDEWAWTTRYEYYDDHSGFTLGTAVPSHMNEVTETFEKKIHKNLITRLEYRYDASNNPIFIKGSSLTDNQSTLELGLMYVFDWKE
jgi:Putative beta-barrel porin-2, OmpL-like. bbp2